MGLIALAIKARLLSNIGQPFLHKKGKLIKVVSLGRVLNMEFLCYYPHYYIYCLPEVKMCPGWWLSKATLAFLQPPWSYLVPDEKVGVCVSSVMCKGKAFAQVLLPA